MYGCTDLLVSTLIYSTRHLLTIIACNFQWRKLLPAQHCNIFSPSVSKQWGYSTHPQTNTQARCRGWWWPLMGLSVQAP